MSAKREKNLAREKLEEKGFKFRGRLNSAREIQTLAALLRNFNANLIKNNTTFRRPLTHLLKAFVSAPSET